VNRVVYGEGAFEATIVYRMIIAVFGAFLAYAALKDWLNSN